MTIRREWMIRSHQVRFEEPDLVIVTFNGPANLEDTQDLARVFQEIAAQHRFFAIVNIAASPTVDKDARSYITQHVRPEWFHAIIYVGVQPLQNFMIKGMLVALHFLGKWSTDFQFAPTEEKGRELVAQLRKKQGAQAS